MKYLINMTRKQRAVSEKERHEPAPWNPRKGRSSKKDKEKSKQERIRVY